MGIGMTAVFVWRALVAKHRIEVELTKLVMCMRNISASFKSMKATIDGRCLAESKNISNLYKETNQLRDRISHMEGQLEKED
jgi:hypothetical protein